MVAKIADKLTGLGVLLALYGVLSSILYFFDYNLTILMWVDLWGPLVGWGLRAGFIVGGGGLAFVASMFDGKDSPEARAAAQAAEHARAAAWAQVVSHPRAQQMAHDLSQYMRITFGQPNDTQTYQVRHIAWQDASYRWADPATNVHYGPDDPRVTNALFYLERADAPQRVAVSQDFATRQLSSPQEVHPATWNMFVGG